MNRQIIQISVIVLFIFTFVYLVDASPNHGRITGLVRSEDDTPLSDVTITVTSPNLMGERNVVTDQRGRFRFPVLPVGEYTLKFERSEMKTLVRSEVNLRPYSTVTIRLNMVEGSPDDVMHVSGPSDLIDVTSSTDKQSIDGDFIRRLPGDAGGM